MTTPVISIKGLGKKFRRNLKGRPFKIKSLLTGKLFGWRYESFWCFRDVTFEVFPGQMIGIIGPNGSGKSTLLRLIGGVGRADEGSLDVRGRIGALLDLGAGFHNDLTARDNIYISGVVAGLTRRQISERFDEIVEFSELKGFLDNPLRTYSSGMRLRLAFAVATNIDPDILLIDEVLAVGDLAFQAKCLEKINRFKQKGCTMLLVSHDIGQIEKFCDTALWLKDGRVNGYAPPREIVRAYADEMSSATRRRTVSAAEGKTVHGTPLKPNENRFGSFEIEISSLLFFDRLGNLVQEIARGEPLRIEIGYTSHLPAVDPIFGVTISKTDGEICCEMMLDRHRPTLQGSRGQGTIVLDIERLDLSGGDYFVDVGIYEKNWEYAYDYQWHVYPIKIVSEFPFKGVLAPPHTWGWSDQSAA